MVMTKQKPSRRIVVKRPATLVIKKEKQQTLDFREQVAKVNGELAPTKKETTNLEDLESAAEPGEPLAPEVENVTEYYKWSSLWPAVLRIADAAMRSTAASESRPS